ncbi:MAG TPA: TIGR01777 family oxidoreductase [Candidatus Acidoferrales bacterium]
MKILISGASGLVGKALARRLQEDGHTIARLVRRGGGKSSPGDIFWDPMAATVDAPAMEGFDAVIHLSGASIAEARWTPERKAVLRSSRIASTRVLVDTLSGLKQKPRVFLCASATGYYGNRGDEVLTESSEGGTDFLALLARDWEAEARRAELAGIRTVRLRFGVILSAEGGALPRMLTPFKCGIGGRLGSGSQWMSWIALEDAVEIVRSAIASEEFSGPLNVVAPNPMRNSDFTRLVAATLHRPAIFSAPAFALRIALGQMADPLLLSSQRVIPKHLTAMGYKFRFPDLDAALRSILARNP